MQPAAAARAARSLSIAMTEQRTPVKILLVEDNEYDAKIVADLFGGLHNGFTLSTADTLRKAGDSDAAEAADVVLLDLNLPDSYGPETLTKAKGLFRDRPIIVMTGYYEEQLGVDLIKRGAQDYLVKGKLTRDWLSYSVYYAIERAKIEAKLRLREQNLREIMEKIPDGFLVAAPDGRALFVNPGAALLLGRRAADLLARPLDLPCDPARPVEAELLRPDGKKIPVEVREVPLHWGGENCRLLMLRDLTPVRALERSRSEFISRVSHELRSPLTVVKESLSLVSDGTAGPASDKQREILQMGLENVERLNRLIDALLDIAKIEAGVMPLNLAGADLRALAAAAAADYAYLAAERHVQLGSGLPPEPLRAWCDADKVREVLDNLLSNALKFTPQGGSVTLSLRPWEGQALFCVENTGAGIEPQDLPKLFTKFAQLGREAGVKGTGLGLAICRGIAEMHQGKVWAESEPGRSTRFFLLLPALGFDEAARLLVRREIALAGGNRSFCSITLALPGDLPGLAGADGAAARIEAFLRTRLRSAHAAVKRRDGQYTVLVSDSGAAECARTVAFLEAGIREMGVIPPGARLTTAALVYPDDFSDEEGFLRRLAGEGNA